MLMFFRTLSALAVFAWLFTPQSSPASEGWVLPMEAGAWRTLKVPGARENHFVQRGDALQVISNGSVSFRYLELPRNVELLGHLSWRWRVDHHSALTSQAQKGRDDRPLAVHLWFDTEGRASMVGNLASLTGRPKVGHLLTYVWGATEATGTILENPYYAKGRVIVLVGAEGRTGQWLNVERDIAQDFIRAFGQAPNIADLRYVAISADTDDFDGQSSAYVRALAFRQP